MCNSPRYYVSRDLAVPAGWRYNLGRRYNLAIPAGWRYNLGDIISRHLLVGGAAGEGIVGPLVTSSAWLAVE
jgi:hypothetical protein